MVGTSFFLVSTRYMEALFGYINCAAATICHLSQRLLPWSKESIRKSNHVYFLSYSEEQGRKTSTLIDEKLSPLQGFERSTNGFVVRHSCTALSSARHLPPGSRGTGSQCSKIFTLYAVEDWLGYVKNGRGIAERKLIDLSFEPSCRGFRLMVAELQLAENRPFNM